MPLLDNNPWWAWVRELPSDEGTPYDYAGNRTYTRKFLVRVKTIDIGAVVVCLCPLLPLEGDYYHREGPVSSEFDLNALLVNKSAARISDRGDDALFWHVTCRYSVNIPAHSTANTNEPQNDLADVSWNFEVKEKSYPFDRDGVPYYNFANQPFTPAFPTETHHPILNISRNELSFNYQKADYYGGSLNDRTFLGAPRGCVQVEPPTSQQKTIKSGSTDIRYQRVSYRLHFQSQNQGVPFDSTYGRYYVYLKPLYAKAAVISTPLKLQTQVGGVSYSTYFGCGWSEFSKGANNGNGGWVHHPDPVTVGPPSDFPSNIPILMPLSWQPTVLNSGLYRIGIAGHDAIAMHGKTIAISKHGHLIHNPVPLGPDGQPLEPSPSGWPMGQWYIRFSQFSYIDIKSLLVKGVS